MTSRRVEDLRDFLITINYGNSEVLTDLKRQFHADINSIRTSTKITNIGHLVKVLKKRDVITENTLDLIAATLPQELYVQYRELKSPVPRIALTSPVINQTAVIEQNNFTTSQHKKNLEKVYSIICEQMGPKHWPVMARKLGIREATIDTNQSRRDTQESIRQILRIHEEHSHPESWRQNLLKALDEAKRSDVRRIVESKLDEFKIIRP